MRQSRFTAEQIIAILAEQERGMRTAEVCRNHGISPNTFYKWKAKGIVKLTGFTPKSR